MKKYLMMLLAATAMLVTTLATTSCSKDEDDTIGTYTLSASIETGNLPEVIANQLEESLATERTFVATLSEAKAEFSYAVSQADSNFSTAISGLKAKGYNGISITIYLKDSKGAVIDKRVWD